jgi:SAM-dependent methyltransferase
VIDAQALDELDRLLEETDRATAEFDALYAPQVEQYRAEVSAGINETLSQLRNDVREISGANRICEQLAEQVSEYVDWLQWTLWDLPFFAVAIRPSLPRFRRAVAACGLLYVSIRVFDDIIDRHFWYKGKHPTLLSVASQTFASSQGAEGLTILAGLLLCFEALLRLADPNQTELGQLLRPVLESVRRAVIGAVMEYTGADELTTDSYERLVELKNVDYWRSLYVALDPDFSSPLYPFLERYYRLAQYLNDVHDYPQDVSRGQPNLVSLYVPQPGDVACIAWDSAVVKSVPPHVEERLRECFLELRGMAGQLPPAERLVAELKLGESLREARRLGVFATSVGATPSAPRPEPQVAWHFDIREIVEQGGVQALERADCGVCESSERSYLFQKQGFAFHRCANCSHIYVSPRLTPALQAQAGEELGAFSADDPYLEVQRAEASALCHLLSTRAPGPRLLDIGFGRGYLMQTAHAYGFEVYGINSAEDQVAQLRPQFGAHVYRAIVGEDDLPSGPFDVVVMSHVLEHLPHPRTLLNDLALVLSPGAVVYTAVPDMDSVQFRVLGKRWDVVNPLVHVQYFNQRSLTMLLERAGFVDIALAPHRLAPAEAASKRMLLMRNLGGTDSGELALLSLNPRRI